MEKVGQGSTSDNDRLYAVLESYRTREAFKFIDGLEFNFIPGPKKGYQFFRCKLTIGKEEFYWPMERSYISTAIDSDTFTEYLDLIESCLQVPFKRIPVEMESFLQELIRPYGLNLYYKDYLRKILLARLSVGM